VAARYYLKPSRIVMPHPSGDSVATTVANATTRFGWIVGAEVS
jgi:hypothetical protein